MKGEMDGGSERAVRHPSEPPQDLPGGRPQAGEKASSRRRTGQHTVLLPQAAPYRGNPDAPERRGRAHPSGGAGPRPFEHHPDLYPCRQ